MPSGPSSDLTNATNIHEFRKESDSNDSILIALGIVVFFLNALILFIFNFLAYLGLYPISGETSSGILIIGLWVGLGVFLIVSSRLLISNVPKLKVTFAYLALFTLFVSILLFGGLALYSSGGRLGYFESIAFMLIHDFPVDIAAVLIGYGSVHIIIQQKTMSMPNID